MVERVKRPLTAWAQRITLVIVASCLACATAWASWPGDPAAGLPICTMPVGQTPPYLVSDGAGGMYVLWADIWAGPSDEPQVRAQHVTRSGEVATGWPVNGVAICPTPGPQTEPIGVSDGSGGLIALWINAGDQLLPPGLGAQRLSADGSPMWGSTGAVIDTFGANESAAVADGAGGVIVAWSDSRRLYGHAPPPGPYFPPDPEHLFVQHLDRNGISLLPFNGTPLAMDSLNAFQGFPSIVDDGSGGAFMAWEDGRPGGAGPDIYAQHLSAQGTLMWPLGGRPVCTAIGYQEYPAVAEDDSGGVYISWEDHRRSDTFSEVYAQHVTSSGAPDPRWPENGLDVSADTLGIWYVTHLVPESDGSVIVSWEGGAGMGATHVQRISPAGISQWGPLGLVIDQAGTNDLDYAIASDNADGAFVVSSDHVLGSPDLYAQHVTSAGALEWPTPGAPVATAPNTQWYPAVISDGGHGLLAAWQDLRSDTAHVVAQNVNADGSLGGDVVGAEASLVSASAEPGDVHLVWYASQARPGEYQVYRRGASSDWKAIGAPRITGDGRILFDDPNVAAGGRYDYRLGSTGSVTQYTPEMWVQVPAAYRFALAGATPNPTRRGQLAVSFTLERSERAALEMFDVSGRLVAEREVGALGPGGHTARMGEGLHLPAGLYWLRLSQGAQRATARVVIAE